MYEVAYPSAEKDMSTAAGVAAAQCELKQLEMTGDWCFDHGMVPVTAQVGLRR